MSVPAMYTGHSLKVQVAIHKKYCDSAIEGYKQAGSTYGLAFMAASYGDEQEAKKLANYLLAKIRTGCIHGVNSRVCRLKLHNRYERLFNLRHEKIALAKPEREGVLLP